MVPTDELFAEDDIDFDIPNPISPKIVCPFPVIVDSNEQHPFHFLNIDPFLIVPLSHRKLKTGDYSIECANRSFDERVTIERKSISDFLSSITNDRERFEREFVRMSTMEFAAVVVEGQLSDVLNHAQANTKAGVESVMGTILSWSVRYKVFFFFCMGRRHAEITTLQILCKFYKEDRARKKAAK